MTLETTPVKKNSAASFPKDGKGSMGIDFLNYKSLKKSTIKKASTIG
jgi:hypothetical protein